MATDLSNVDTNPAVSPGDGDPVSQGASRIRDTRTATMNSFGGTDNGSPVGGAQNEHYLSGPHKFPRGDGSFPLVGVPAAGNAGRVFLDTTNGRLLRDTGTVWQMLHGIDFHQVLAAGPTNAGLNGNFSVLATVSINKPTNGHIIAIASGNVSAVPVTGTLSVRIRYDAATVLDGSLRSLTDSNANTSLWFTIMGIDSAEVMATGNHTITLEASNSLGSTFTLNTFTLVVAVV